MRDGKFEPSSAYPWQSQHRSERQGTTRSRIWSASAREPAPCQKNIEAAAQPTTVLPRRAGLSEAVVNRIRAPAYSMLMITTICSHVRGYWGHGHRGGLCRGGNQWLVHLDRRSGEGHPAVGRAFCTDGHGVVPREAACSRTEVPTGYGSRPSPNRGRRFLTWAADSIEVGQQHPGPTPADSHRDEPATRPSWPRRTNRSSGSGRAAREPAATEPNRRNHSAAGDPCGLVYRAVAVADPHRRVALGELGT